jgi:CDP-diglyceride synthetase
LAGLSFIALLKLVGKDRFSYSLDLGLNFQGKRIFGMNKTIKGPVVMAFFTGIYGLLLVYILKLEVAPGFTAMKYFYSYSWVGLAYSLGELPNSFIKRRLSIPPGGISKREKERHFFTVLDTFDSLLACGVAYSIFFKFPASVILISILIGGCLHLLTDRLMIVLRLKARSE